MDFRFNFESKENPNEIQINPIKGLIPKYSYINIEISFLPTKQ